MYDQQHCKWLYAGSYSFKQQQKSLSFGQLSGCLQPKREERKHSRIYVIFSQSLDASLWLFVSMAFRVPPWLLWLQAAYSLWTFLRNAKFLRVPFILFSMIWNGGLERTWFRKRKFLLMDGTSRETGGDWQDFDTEEKRADHKFEMKGNHDMSFELGGRMYRFCASFETGKPLKFLHYAKHYFLACDDLVLVAGVHLVRSVSPDEMIHYVLTGGVIKSCEEFCLVDNTSSELLNNNFMRILSILPLALQAKGFDQISTAASLTIVVLDIFSYYFNKFWQKMTFKVVKLLLAKLNVRHRRIAHELLATGSESFMFTDDSVKKTYYKTVQDFPAVRGCALPLDAATEDIGRETGDFGNEISFTLNSNQLHIHINNMEGMEDLFDVTVTDSNGFQETRHFLDKAYVGRIVKYFRVCQETGNYPFQKFTGSSSRVVNPIKAMIAGLFEWAILVHLPQSIKCFIE